MNLRSQSVPEHPLDEWALSMADLIANAESEDEAALIELRALRYLQGWRDAGKATNPIRIQPNDLEYQWGFNARRALKS